MTPSHTPPPAAGPAAPHDPGLRWLRRTGLPAALAATTLLCSAAMGAPAGRGDANAERHGPPLRQLVDQQVGGIAKLVVPPDDASIPVPRLPDGSVNPRYRTTEAKRYLGKMLFHDPVRTARIDPAFGGAPATRQSASCGSCHLGEAAGKAGAVLNFAVGGEGRGYTDAQGNFVIRRRPRADLPLLRPAPLFEGDTRVDALPTLTDIYLVPPLPGHVEVATPARGRRDPLPLQLLATGRLDALDSVGRQSPGMIGFAFNNRLLLGGFAGEPDSVPGALNPFGDPAQENLTLLLLDAHRMLERQSAELVRIPAFVKLFRDAFPDRAAQADAARDINLLVNDETVFLATASFLRTMVTRNTPFDRWLAGQEGALTPRQRHGARLFFTPATQGGAGCVACHSGPMLNKQVNDPDVAGVGRFVEENFINVGIGDHPVQALNRAARNDPGFHDTGRQEITGNPDHAFKFRSLTLRQLKDARTFFHNGSFTSVRDVVQYFNAGVPQDAAAGAAPTLDARFTHPRGAAAGRGLGLDDRQVDALTDFLENALYDPAFVTYDPRSTTPTLQPNERDLTYSRYRTDLAALGARDGFMLSGLAMDNDDPLSRRDQGLEFLDVTAQAQITLRSRSLGGGRQQDVWRIVNNGNSVIDTHLLVVTSGLPARVRLDNGSGTTQAGAPYLRVFLPDGVIPPGRSIEVTLVLRREGPPGPLNYRLGLLSGQGRP